MSLCYDQTTMADDDKDHLGGTPQYGAGPTGGAGVPGAEARRPPGRPKRTATARPPRQDIAIAPSSVSRFLEETNLVQRLKFDVCAAAYRRLETARTDVAEHPGVSAFATVLATIEEESRTRFDADTRGWAERILRCFPDDSIAIRWGRRLPDNVLQAVFIADVWDRDNGRGGAKRAEHVFKDDVRRLKSKLSEWRKKLIADGQPAAANLIGIPFAGAIMFFDGAADATTVAMAKPLAIVAAVLAVLAVVLGGITRWTHCNADNGGRPARTHAPQIGDGASTWTVSIDPRTEPSAISPVPATSKRPSNRALDEQPSKAEGDSTSASLPTNAPPRAISSGAISSAWEELTSSSERDRHAIFFGGGPTDSRIGLGYLSLGEMDVTIGTAKLHVSALGESGAPTCEAVLVDDVFGGWCQRGDPEVGTIMLGWLVREEGAPRVEGVLWRVSLPAEPFSQQPFCFGNKALERGRGCAVGPCFEADAPTSEQEFARLCAAHPNFTPCLHPASWQLPTADPTNSNSCLTSSALANKRIRE